MRSTAFALTALAVLALPACKPPPTDAAFARTAILPDAGGPSAPLPSPDTGDAVWAQGNPESGTPQRLVYGLPGQPVLLALQCMDDQTGAARIRITRHAPADSGAGALLALIGNGTIGRFPVDATPQGGRLLWQGEAPALARGWDAFEGKREATVTVPGAGLVRLNPSPLPFQLVEACRGTALPEPPANRG